MQLLTVFSCKFFQLQRHVVQKTRGWYALFKFFNPSVVANVINDGEIYNHATVPTWKNKSISILAGRPLLLAKIWTSIPTKWE